MRYLVRGGRGPEGMDGRGTMEGRSEGSGGMERVCRWRWGGVGVRVEGGRVPNG